MSGGWTLGTVLGQHVQSQPEFGREPVLEGSSTQVLHCSHWVLEVAIPSSGHTAEHSAAAPPAAELGPKEVGRGLEPVSVEQGLVLAWHNQLHPALCLQPTELGQGSHFMLCLGRRHSQSTARTCRWPCTEPAWVGPELVQSLGMLTCLCCCAPPAPGLAGVC